MLTLLATVAGITGLCSAALPALQIRKMLLNRSAAGVSVLYLAGSLANGAVWFAYGMMLGNLAIILSNGLWIAMCTTMIVVARMLSHHQQAATVQQVARAVAEDPEVAHVFHAAVKEHKAERLATADTLILRPGDAPTLILSPA
jgi:hypothetical protein